MNDPRYDPEYEYDDYDQYDDYRDVGQTSLGLPPSQLALIIGVNAVISLVISIAVVLLANRQALPSDVATPVADAGEAVAEEIQAQEPASPEDAAGVEIGPESTAIQSVTYVVEAGDTLSLIAGKFSVSVADLMLANGLTNEDFIQIGQELIIPLGDLSVPTPTFTPVIVPTDTPLPFDPPTPLPADVEIPQEPAATVGPSATPSHTPTPAATPTPIPTSTPAPFDEINVVINEITGAGDLLRESLVILNQGANTSLKDWKLEGSPLAVFTFPDIFLFSGGSIRIHTAAGENTPSDVYLNQGEPAFPPGTTIILSDASNTEISRFTVPEATSTP
jgi:LysM repeat protein